MDNDFIFGGNCGFQYGGYDAQLNDVAIHAYKRDSWNNNAFRFWHGYNHSIFNDSQLSHLLNGGIITHTFGYRKDNDGNWVEVNDFILN